MTVISLEYYQCIFDHLMTLRFADDHRMLVEIACGSVLASVYSGLLGKVLQEKGVAQGAPVIAVICGGNIVNTSLVTQWRQELGM